MLPPSTFVNMFETFLSLAHFPTLSRLPLARVNDAFALIEGRATMGKVVLEP